MVRKCHFVVSPPLQKKFTMLHPSPTTKIFSQQTHIPHIVILKNLKFVWFIQVLDTIGNQCLLALPDNIQIASSSSNTIIFKSMRLKVLKFFLHIFIVFLNKILWLEIIILSFSFFFPSLV
jgi:hypothetical protein